MPGDGLYKSAPPPPPSSCPYGERTGGNSYTHWCVCVPRIKKPAPAEPLRAHLLGMQPPPHALSSAREVSWHRTHPPCARCPTPNALWPMPYTLCPVYATQAHACICMHMDTGACIPSCPQAQPNQARICA